MGKAHSNRNDEQEILDLHIQLMDLVIALAKAEGRIEAIQRLTDYLLEDTQRMISDLAQPVKDMGAEMMTLSSALKDFYRKNSDDLTVGGMYLLERLVSLKDSIHE